MITKELGKKILLYFLGLVVVTLIVLPLFIHTNNDKDNQLALQKLDEISKRLSDIGLRVEEINWQIGELDYEKDNLISEQTKLNDEAAAIFMSMMTPEMLTTKESTWAVACYGCSHYDADTNSCIEWDKRSRWCEANFPTDTLEEWNEDWWESNDDRWPGKLAEDWSSQQMPEIEWETSHERFKQLAYKYWLDPSLIWEYENKYNLREGLLLAVLIAETSGWHNGNYVDEWCYNLGNVNNTDSGKRTCFDTKEESIEQVAITLNNKYLWKIQTLWCLSNAGSCDAKFDTWYRYATSNGNRERNVLNVLNLIYEPELWKIDPGTFNIRRNFTQFQ